MRRSVICAFQFLLLLLRVGLCDLQDGQVASKLTALRQAVHGKPTVAVGILSTADARGEDYRASARATWYQSIHVAQCKPSGGLFGTTPGGECSPPTSHWSSGSIQIFFIVGGEGGASEREAVEREQVTHRDVLVVDRLSDAHPRAASLKALEAIHWLTALPGEPFSHLLLAPDTTFLRPSELLAHVLALPPRLRLAAPLSAAGTSLFLSADVVKVLGQAHARQAFVPRSDPWQTLVPPLRLVLPAFAPHALPPSLLLLCPCEGAAGAAASSSSQLEPSSASLCQLADPEAASTAEAAALPDSWHTWIGCTSEPRPAAAAPDGPPGRAFSAVWQREQRASLEASAWRRLLLALVYVYRRLSARPHINEFLRGPSPSSSPSVLAPEPPADSDSATSPSSSSALLPGRADSDSPSGEAAFPMGNAGAADAAARAEAIREGLRARASDGPPLVGMVAITPPAVPCAEHSLVLDAFLRQDYPHRILVVLYTNPEPCPVWRSLNDPRVLTLQRDALLPNNVWKVAETAGILQETDLIAAIEPGAFYGPRYLSHMVEQLQAAPSLGVFYLSAWYLMRPGPSQDLLYVDTDASYYHPNLLSKKPGMEGFCDRVDLNSGGEMTAQLNSNFEVEYVPVAPTKKQTLEWAPYITRSSLHRTVHHLLDKAQSDGIRELEILTVQAIQEKLTVRGERDLDGVMYVVGKGVHRGGKKKRQHVEDTVITVEGTGMPEAFMPAQNILPPFLLEDLFGSEGAQFAVDLQNARDVD